MRYFNFDLLIEKASDDSFVARVLESPVGQARSTFLSPFTPMELEILILRVGPSRRGNRSFDNIPTRAAKDLGGRLFESVFTNEVRVCLQSSIHYAESQNGGLRIRLRLDTPGLADLPWEYLYNASLNSFLALSAETSLVRYLDLARPMRPPVLSPPLKVLGLIASPADYPKHAGEDEWKFLNVALQPLSAARQVDLDRLKQPTLAALRARLRRGSYHVLHFIGHGGFDDRAQDGLLILENDHGRGDQVTSHRLATILHNHPSLQLVVLNCCEGARLSVNAPFSGVAQSLIQQGVPAVIAMQFEISDDAAITFGRVFYESLADGLAVDAALVEARTGMYSTRDDVEFGAPVLYMRSPDGVLFNLARPHPAENTVEVQQSEDGDLPRPEPAPPVEAAPLPATESETNASSNLARPLPAESSVVQQSRDRDLPSPETAPPAEVFPPLPAESEMIASSNLARPRPVESTVEVQQSGDRDLPSPETAPPVEVDPPLPTKSETIASSDPDLGPPDADPGHLASAGNEWSAAENYQGGVRKEVDDGLLNNRVTAQNIDTQEVGRVNSGREEEGRTKGLPLTWWERIWPAWFGAASMLSLHVLIVAWLYPNITKTLGDIKATLPLGVGMVLLLFIAALSFACGCLFSANHSLTPLRRFIGGASIPFAFFLVACTSIFVLPRR